MSTSLSTMTINMLPVMRELFQLQQSSSYPISSDNASHFGISSLSLSATGSSYSYSSNRTSPSLAFTPLTSLNYSALVQKVRAILDSGHTPEAYTDKLIRPFYNKLVLMQATGFASQLRGPNKAPIESIAHAILQNFGDTTGEKVPRKNTEAIREVISDLYQKFLHTTCSHTPSAPCLQGPSPVPNWSQEDLSTYPQKTLGSFGVGVSTVNIPFRYATKSAITWGCLGHEVAGHDILGAYPNARNELQRSVTAALRNNQLSDTAFYWSNWFDETASDVLGVLNMGPAAAFSLIAFLRSLGAQNEDDFKLSARGYINDEHPIDLLRGFLVAYVVQAMPVDRFSKGAEYAQLVMREVEKDATGINNLKFNTIVLGELNHLKDLLGDFLKKQRLQLEYPSSWDEPMQTAIALINNEKLKDPFTKFLASEGLPQTRKSARLTENIHKMSMLHIPLVLDDFKRSAKIVAQTIMNQPLQALGGLSLSNIRCWNNGDEKIQVAFKKVLSGIEKIGNYSEGYFAAHVVSAAVIESISDTRSTPITQEKLEKVFGRMVSVLQSMHTTNPEWQQES